MVQVMIGLVSSISLAFLAKRLWPATVGKNKKFTPTILSASLTVLMYVWAFKEYGPIYPSFLLGLLILTVGIVVVLMMYRHRQELEEQSLFLDSEAFELENRRHDGEPSGLNDSPLPVPEQDDRDEIASSPKEEQGPSYSSDQEAIDAMIKEFYRQTGQGASDVQETVAEQQPAAAQDTLVASEVTAEQEIEPTQEAAEPEELGVSNEDTPFEQVSVLPPVSELLSTEESSRVITEQEVAEIVQAFIIQEPVQQEEQAADQTATQNLTDEELLLNRSWQEAVAALEETAISQASAAQEESLTMLQTEENELVSDLSSLLREELGESVARASLQPVSTPLVKQVTEQVAEHRRMQLHKQEPTTPAYQAPVHQNKLANEKPSSIVLKMEELVVPAEEKKPEAAADEKPAGYLFELEELVDPSTKK